MDIKKQVLLEFFNRSFEERAGRKKSINGNFFFDSVFVEFIDIADSYHQLFSIDAPNF